jgi:LysM repeat protein
LSRQAEPPRIEAHRQLEISVMTIGFSPVPLPAPPDNRPNSDTTTSDPAATTPTSPNTGGATGSGRDTKVFGNLEGRDPDLLFAGEKIMINGKEVTVAEGDTLSSLAAKHGTTVDALIKENKMDASLLGKNGPNGAYFTPGGPQPANGGSTTPPPANGTAAPSDTPSTSATTPARSNTPGSPADGTSSGSVSGSTSGPSTANNPPLKPPKLSDRDSYGLEGGPITSTRLQSVPMNALPDGNSNMLTPWQVQHAKQLLLDIQSGAIPAGGIHLGEQDKAILNWYMKDVLQIAAVPSSPGNGSFTA